jgi:glycosyltransferase involved in cell wall biosynthesis
MHIGYDAKRFFLNRAGLGNYSRVLLEAIWKSYPEIRMTLFTPNTRGSHYSQKDLPDEAEVCTNSSLLPDALWRTRRITGLCQDRHIDLYHGLSHEIPANWNPKAIPAVMTVHDVLFLDYPQEYKSLDRFFYRAKLMSSIAKCQHLICVSKYTKERLLAHVPVPEEKITVIPPPVNLSYWSGKGVEDGTIPEVPSSYLLFVGTWGERKNLKNALRALEKLNWPVPLVVVGKVAAEIMTYVSGKPVRFLQNLSNEQIRTLYQNSEALLYPSLAEGFGLPVVEALASGTRVITSNRGALIEAAAGLATLCDPEDVDSIAEAILSVLTDQKKETRGNKEMLLPFDAAEVALKTVGLYRNLLS